jgi:hypothetical protein
MGPSPLDPRGMQKGILTPMRPLSPQNKQALLCFIASAVMLLGVLSLRGFQDSQFKRACTDHLHRASVANTTELASSELGIGLKYLEDHALTAGNTAIFYQTPTDDIGFWYQNLKAAQGVLQHVPKDASQLERTNVLLKLKESIVSPPGDIAVYPNQRTWIGVMLIIFAFFMFCFGWSLATLP